MIGFTGLRPVHPYSIGSILRIRRPTTR